MVILSLSLCPLYTKDVRSTCMASESNANWWPCSFDRSYQTYTIFSTAQTNITKNDFIYIILITVFDWRIFHWARNFRFFVVFVFFFFFDFWKFKSFFYVLYLCIESTLFGDDFVIGQKQTILVTHITRLGTTH